MCKLWTLSDEAWEGLLADQLTFDFFFSARRLVSWRTTSDDSFPPLVHTDQQAGTICYGLDGGHYQKISLSKQERCECECGARIDFHCFSKERREIQCNLENTNLDMRR